MYYSHLCQIVDYLNQHAFKTLSKISRIDDNVLELTLDRDFYLCIDLQKSQSAIYRQKNASFAKMYQAAFDTILQKRFGRTKIEGFEIVNDDKVMRQYIELRAKVKRKGTCRF